MSDTIPAPTPSDVLLARVILALGLIGLVAVVGMVVLAFYDRTPPDALSVTLGAVVGALGSVLVGRRP